MEKENITVVIDTLDVCSDCLHAHGNGEFADAEHQELFCDYEYKLSKDGCRLAMGNCEESFFSHSLCQICDALAGDRYILNVLKDVPKNPNIQFMPDNSVRKYTSVGGYPLFYITKAYESVCPSCVQKELAYYNDEIKHTHVNWDSDLYCECCDEKLEKSTDEGGE